jgi:hypothetical protein
MMDGGWKGAVTLLRLSNERGDRSLERWPAIGQDDIRQKPLVLLAQG